MAGIEEPFSIVDAVSILGGDELPVDKWNVDISITASQKALEIPFPNRIHRTRTWEWENCYLSV
jgi:hypothetical protein